jgi:hypothetical protein
MIWLAISLVGPLALILALWLTRQATRGLTS